MAHQDFVLLALVSALALFRGSPSRFFMEFPSAVPRVVQRTGIGARNSGRV
jgi:hypothetical protein